MPQEFKPWSLRHSPRRILRLLCLGLRPTSTILKLKTNQPLDPPASQILRSSYTTFKMRFNLHTSSLVNFLKRKGISLRTTWKKEALQIFRWLSDRDRLVTAGIHLPLYVASAICVLPFVYSRTGDSPERLRLAKGWRRKIGFIMQLMVTVRVLCIYSLCLDEKFRWTFNEYFTGDAVAYCAISALCSYSLISVVVMNFLGEEFCQLYNATRRLADRFAGKK